MEIHARNIAVHGPHGQLLPATSLRVAEGQVALVKAGRQEATAFALAISGRLELTTGAVLLDGEADEQALRRLVAVIDSPEVSEPEAALPLSAVVAEEIAYTGGSADRNAVDEWLHKLGAERYATARFESVPPTLRVEILTALAAARPGVRALVLDRPDRHAEDDPSSWWPSAIRHAKRGLAVVVLCSPAIARLMGVPSATIGLLDQPDAIVLAPDPPADAASTQTLPTLAERGADQ
ncbi:MAG: ABC transporter ATP-binding protein [Sciscionella sp.]